MSRMGKNIARIVCIAMAFCAMCFSMNNASAISDSEIIDKALKGALNICTNSKFNYEQKIDIGANRFSIVDDTSVRPNLVSVIKKSGEFYMPTSIGNNLGIQPINCYEVLNGVKASGTRNSSYLITGLVSRYGKDASTATPEDIGYIPDESDETERACFSISYRINYVDQYNNSTGSYEDFETNKLCYPLEGGKISSEDASVATGYDVTELDGKNPDGTSRDVEKDGGIRLLSYNGIVYYRYDTNGNPIEVSYGKTWGQLVTGSLVGKTPDEVVSLMENNLDVTGHSVINANIETKLLEPLRVKMEEGVIREANNTKYVISPDFTVRRDNITAWLAGTTDAFYQNLDFTNEDEAYIYAAYIASARTSGEITVNSSCTASAEDDNVISYDGGSTWCKVDIIRSASYAVKQNGQNRFWLEDITKVIARAKELTLAGVVINDNVNNGNNGNQNVPTTTDSGDPCYNAGVEGISWILCPALNNMTHTASAMDLLIRDWLEVDPTMYNNGSIARGVWEGMRNLANVLMIIVLIAIIFSQLTGYGIDNYGIKKMLPRLIMMAALINLSFIICEVAIDIANIAGEGLNDLFGGWGDAILEQSTGSSTYIGGMVTAIIAAAAGGGAASAGFVITIATAIASGNIAMIVVVVVLALLVVVAAVLLFFIALGARLVIIIGCVSVAPLAFAAFILPNTQGLFKKWLNVFKAAILMYPLCGALGGISTLIKGIVVNQPEVTIGMAVVAIVAPFLPFFVLPSLLKGSIAMLGKAGMAFMAMGTAWRGGIRHGRDAVQNTEAYKSTMQEGRMNMMRKSIGMNQDGTLNERGQKKLQKAQKKGGAALKMYASRLAMVNKDNGIKEEASRMLFNTAARTAIANNKSGYTDENGVEQALGADWGSAFTDNDGKTREAYYARQFLTAAEAGKVAEMNAAIEAAKAAGMKDKYIAQMVRNAINHGNIKFKDKNGNIDANAQRAWAQDLAAKHGNGFLATDFELSHWAMSGGDTPLGGYGEYAVNKPIGIDDIKKDDLLKLSGDSLAGMASAGLISAAMAQQVLSENPNLSEDKKIMFGAIASGYAGRGIDAATFKQQAENILKNYASGAPSALSD